MSHKLQLASRKRPAGGVAPDADGWFVRLFGWIVCHPIATVVAFALLVKCAVLAQLGNHPLLAPHGELDTAYYVDLARRVAAGGPLAVTEPFAVSPLYVFYLAGVFKLTGGSLLAARFLQVLLGSAAVGLLHATTRHWFGARAAWAASGLAVMTGLFTFYEVLILQASLDPFLVACTLYWLTRSQRDSSWWHAGVAGLSCGLLALNRPNALACAVVFAVGLGLAARNRTAREPGALRCRTVSSGPVAFILAILLTLVPNAIRTYAVSAEWVPVSSHGGLNFYIGNAEEATGIYRRVPGIAPSIAGQTRDARRVAEQAQGRRLTSGEVSAYFFHLGWDWTRAHPTRALRLAALKVAYLLNRTNVPLNYSYAYFSRDASPLLGLLAVGPWLLVPVGLVGLLLRSARRNREGFWVWGSFAPVYGLSVAAFFVSSRYRMPMLVPLCASAGGALAWAWDALGARRYRALVPPLVLLALMAIVTGWDWGLDDGRGGEQTRQAVWLIEQGRVEEAQRFVDRIAPGHSHSGVLRFSVGQALADTGRPDEAIERFEEAREIDGNQPAIHLALGQALVAAGRPASEAVPHLEAALDARFRPEESGPALVAALEQAGERQRALSLIRSLPDSTVSARPEKAFDLGLTALELSAPDAAERWLRLAVVATPGDAEAHEKLGVALVMLSRAAEAVAPLEQACRLAPASASAQLNLAVAYAETGRLTEASEHALEAARLDPSDAQTAGLLRALFARTGRIPR